MADKYQESILEAIDYLINNRVESLDRDKTIIATITACTNALTQEYKVSYNGGFIVAYGQDSTSYSRNESVYVLVPQGDFSQKKTIIGKATSSKTDGNLSFVSSLMSDYNRIGDNALSGQKRWGLNSYKKEDYKLLYKHGYEDADFISIDEDSFKTYLQQAQAMLVQGTFQTNLPREHRVSASGSYGVQFVLAFQNGDSTVAKYGKENLAKSTGMSSEGLKEDQKDGNVSAYSDASIKFFDTVFNNYCKTLLATWSDSSILIEAKKTKTQTVIRSIQNLILDAGGVELPNFISSLSIAKTKYEIETAINKLKYDISSSIVEDVHNGYDSDKFALYVNILSVIEKSYPQSAAQAASFLADEIEMLQSIDDSNSSRLSDILQEQTPAVKYLSYVIDSYNMLGNPMLYASETSQYSINSIDAANYMYVDSVMIYCKDFVEETDSDRTTNNIFFSDFQLYGLRKIESKNGDYVLRLGTPQGAIFKTTSAKETLRVVGNVTKLGTDLSDTAAFYWFAKDDRVSSSSESYQMYGGAGWRYLKDAGNNKELLLKASENRAYENPYLCVAVYKATLVLKTQFSVYNEACNKDIAIESNLGTSFSFDRGAPTLTCTIDGKSEEFDEKHDDSLFSFSWSKKDSSGSSMSLNTTYGELKAEYDAALKDSSVSGYSTLLSYLNQMEQMKEVSVNRNVLVYPISQINDSATFSCSVFLQDDTDSDAYFIGSAEITLKNADVAEATDYHIQIENGDQVFQYSESGVAPDNERYTDPQEVLPLSCRFFDPAGLEINDATYSVKWVVPLTDSMIVAPKEGLVLNPATNKYEWYPLQEYPLDIRDSFDYQAVHNQITCVVTYQEQEFMQASDLLFTKIGDNGTNGTDVVAKISPMAQPKDGLLAIEVVNKVPSLNSGRALTQQVLSFSLYRRNELISSTNVSWSIAGGNASARNLSVADGILSWGELKGTLYNQIVKGSCSYRLDDGNSSSVAQTYYAFYPVPTIEYGNIKQYSVSIDKEYTLKQILYNADGRNPLYNKKQGLFLKVTGAGDGKKILWDTIGGADNANPALFVSAEEDRKTLSTDGIVSVYAQEELEDGVGIYIAPADNYSGKYSNNCVRARIFRKDVDEMLGNPEVTVIVPIQMMLNTFGLASLNAWDGNHIDINEDGDYILAPQIGAGTKDAENKFTGVVMGKADTYNSSNPSIGLLGYSKGRQSIWLDSETGKAVFGLPEDQGDANNKYTEGRIELIPNGTSKIGMWSIGSRAIYNMSEPPVFRKVAADEEKGILEHLEIRNSDGSWEAVSDSSGVKTSASDFKGVDPITPPFKGYVNSSRYAVANATISTPPQAQGMILSANPAYISVKSMPLTDQNSLIDWGAANTALKIGDSLEVEIDPVKSSVFSIYRHTTYDGETDTGKMRRYPLVGINSNGQFYTNAIQDQESSMGIGKVGAFNSSAADGKYIGAQFAYDTSNILKFFVQVKDDDGKDNTSLAKNGPVFFSTGSRVGLGGNEYARDMKFYGNKIELYSSETSNQTKSSDHFVKLSDDSVSIGHEGTSLTFDSDKSSNSASLLSVAGNFSSSIGRQLSCSVDGETKVNLNSPLTANLDSDSTSDELAAQVSANGSISASSSGYIRLDGGMDSNGAAQATLLLSSSGLSNTASLSVTPSGNDVFWTSKLDFTDTGHISLESNDGMEIHNNTGDKLLISSWDGVPVQIDARQRARDGAAEDLNVGASYLHLTPSVGGYSSFNLYSRLGSVYTEPGKDIPLDGSYNINNVSAVSIDPGLMTQWGYFSSQYGASSGAFRNCGVYAVNGVCGSKFVFNNGTNPIAGKSWNAYNNTKDSDDLEAILKWLCERIDAAGSKADSAYIRAETAELNAKTYAQNAADAAEKAAKNACVEIGGTSYNEIWRGIDGKAPSSIVDKFDAHTHLITDQLHTMTINGTVFRAYNTDAAVNLKTTGPK